jgi:phosphatidylserine/phosphatidylglycerophosphate/cardiolipin synthase-like enzyme
MNALILIAALSVTCQTVAWFSPNGGTAAEIVSEINRSTKTAYVAMYALDAPDLTTALIAARNRNVKVSVKLDRLQSGGKWQQIQINRMRVSQIPVMVSKLKALQHSKFMVIDSKRVLTGSYNWTNSAEHWNRENMVLLDCPEIAAQYKKAWDTIQ